MVISNAGAYPACGAGAAIPTIRPDGSVLVSVRSHLRAGRVVCAMVDSVQPSPQWSIEVRTANGSLWVADQLLRLARRCDASIVFVAGRVERCRVAVTLQRLAATSDEDTLIRDLVSFVEAHLGETATRESIADRVALETP